MSRHILARLTLFVPRCRVQPLLTRCLCIALPLLALAPLSLADLTPAQKTSDFMQLVALYAVNYAPYELKRDVFGFDLYNVQPWLDQINKSTSDVQFYDILARYVASLQDSHDEFTINSDYDAWMHMDGDMYDGKFLIDYIDRKYLPVKQYPFTIGDQLISVDGVAVSDLLTQFEPYAVNGSSNPVSRRRLAAATITERYQGWYPLASVGANATIIVQRQSGATETYTIPWDVTGTLVTTAGIIPSPVTHSATRVEGLHKGPRNGEPGTLRKGIDPANGPLAQNSWLASGTPSSEDSNTTEVQPDPAPPAYMAPLAALDNMHGAYSESINGSGLSPFSSLFPVFNPPSGFKLRLGLAKTDVFLSGTFPAGSATIGFIRIPNFAPTSQATAVQQFSTEIQYFQQNTDGLVIDIMANGGGSLCYGQTLATYLIPNTFQGVSEQLRATVNWQASFSSALYSAKASGAPTWVTDLYATYLAAVKQALQENRGRTGSLPLCGVSLDVSPATASGKMIAYTKPILVLTDNFTLSTAESFTMALQDNNRATIYGMRTDGGGGNVVPYSNATAYSQGSARVTQGLILRLNPIAANGYPSMLFYDGVGIQPDIAQDYMTADNLASGGAAFVQGFTSAIKTLAGQ